MTEQIQTIPADSEGSALELVRGHAIEALNTAAAEQAEARRAVAVARRKAAAAVLQARAAKVPWARLREVTGASRQALLKRIDRHGQGLATDVGAGRPKAEAVRRVEAAWVELADAEAVERSATAVLAAAVVTARDVGVRWKTVEASTGRTEATVVHLVRRAEAHAQAGGGTVRAARPLWRGTRPEVPAKTESGPWRWPSVHRWITTAGDTVGDTVRADLVAAGTDPVTVVARVRDARQQVVSAAVTAIESAGPAAADDPQQLIALGRAAADDTAAVVLAEQAPSGPVSPTAD